MENVIKEWTGDGSCLHFTLIDPDKQDAEKAGRLAAVCEGFGSDAIMVGGSTAAGSVVDDVTKAVKDSVGLPVILFPNGIGGVSRHADYIFFMSLLNSTRRDFLVGEQVKAAPLLKGMNVEPIPMGYILVSTSSEPTMVEKVAQPDVIRPGDVDKAVAYALTAQYFGMHCVYLEAGSGAEKPVPDKMINCVKAAIDVPLIIGGGIRNPETASMKVAAGADVIVTGTIVEQDPGMQENIILAVKG